MNYPNSDLGYRLKKVDTWLLLYRHNYLILYCLLREHETWPSLVLLTFLYMFMSYNWVLIKSLNYQIIFFYLQITKQCWTLNRALPLKLPSPTVIKKF